MTRRREEGHDDERRELEEAGWVLEERLTEEIVRRTSRAAACTRRMRPWRGSGTGLAAGIRSGRRRRRRDPREARNP